MTVLYCFFQVLYAGGSLPGVARLILNNEDLCSPTEYAAIHTVNGLVVASILRNSIYKENRNIHPKNNVHCLSIMDSRLGL
jgi:hypothetical protein